MTKSISVAPTEESRTRKKMPLIDWRGHISGRHHGEGPHDYCEDTRLFGFWWWRWFPRMHWNGGTMRDACTDITASWLCFSVSLTLWWNAR